MSLNSTHLSLLARVHGNSQNQIFIHPVLEKRIQVPPVFLESCNDYWDENPFK